MGSMTYMCKNRHGTYYARFIIPKHLQSHFDNKKEIRRSLQTDSRKLAVKRARVYRVQFESIVDQLMSNTDNTSERAKRILDSLFADKATLQEEVTEQFAARMRNNPAEFNNDDLSKTQFITFIDLNGNPATVDTGNDEQDAKIYNLIKPTPSDAELTLREKRDEELHQAKLAAVTMGTLAASPQPTGKKTTEYLDDYIAHKLMPDKKGSWGAGTARQRVKRDKDGKINKNKGKLGAFNFVFGDKLAAELTRDDMEHYIKIAYAIPSNFGSLAPEIAPEEETKPAKFKGITLDMILTGAPEIEAIDYEVRGAGTVRDDLKIIKAFLDWVSKRKDVSSLQNAINALNNEISDIDYESDRRAFEDDELKTLFIDDNPASENYPKGFSKPINFWLPLIGLYTGARLAEICQLHISDIKQVEALSSDTKHWCIDINDDDDKKLKTKHSKRQIPIHQNLINAGLITYVDNLKSKRETKLFPDAARASDQFGGQSQWFGAYSSNAGVTDKNTAFHSFRHNFCSYLSAHHVPEDLVIALSGHQHKSIAKSTYDRSRKRDVGKLAEVIDSIDYGLIHPEWKIY